MGSMKKIVVLGTGYVGLVSGACLADWGHEVICVDINSDRVAALQRGQVPIFEPGLDELLLTNMASGNLAFTTDLAEAMDGADVALIAVGTPSSGIDGEADLSYVFSAARDIAAGISGKIVIVTKSTVPVGTGDRIEAIIRGLRPDAQFAVASNPEFLREGSAILDFKKLDRVVIGTESSFARSVLADVYRVVEEAGMPIVFTQRRSAELIKYGSNAFLAAKITFINEMADLCEEIGADISEVANGMGLDKRIGATFLKAGPGYGGSCFPKDTIALLRTAQEFGVSMRLVEQTISVNTARKRTLANRVRSMLNGDLKQKRIAILGLTFKANTDDMRDSPSLSLIRALQNDGAVVHAFDPEGVANARQLLHNVVFFQDPYECARGAEAIVLMTDWDCLLDLDFARLGDIMRQKRVLDLRGVYDGEILERAHGFVVHTVGRRNAGSRNPLAAGALPANRIALSGLIPATSRHLDEEVHALPVAATQLEELLDG